MIERTTARAAEVQATTESYPTTDCTLIRSPRPPPTLATPRWRRTARPSSGPSPTGPSWPRCGSPSFPRPRSRARAAAMTTPELACYGANDKTMILPGDQPAGSDVSVNYVIAHEYGHHIAANRSNAPLAALDFGPKRWSSYELVCKNTIDGRLAPGDEGTNYLSNPGEAWAEAYARLVFPAEAWRFTPLLQADPGLDARRHGRRHRAMGQACQPDLHGHRDAHVPAPGHARRRLHAAARRARGSELRHRRQVGRLDRRTHDHAHLEETASTTGSRAATTAPRTCASRSCGAPAAARTR